MRARLMLVGLVAAMVMVASTTPDIAHADGTGIDETHLPVGKTATKPTVGGLWTCQTTFNGGGGALTAGSWFNGDGTYDKTKKLSVDGSVSWPNASFKITKSASMRVFTTNDLPTDHTTGTFPIASTDDAYQFDRNPNSIKAQTLSLSVPLHPKAASYQSKLGRPRQTHPYPIQGTAAGDFCDLAFDAFQPMASNAPCTGLTPSDRALEIYRAAW